MKEEEENKIDEVALEVEKLRDSVDKVVRRIDDLQKTVDLLFKDREILEDLQGSIRKLEEISLQTRTHHDNVIKDVKAEVKESRQSVENKVTQKAEEVKDQVNNKTVVIRAINQGILEKLKHLFKERNGEKKNNE